ncbi:MAG: HAMP domain-containing histidine kinase [Candidatus Cloacimonetes bacterium]|jgi:signal transduction histidine kinase|nr:HAMP domain-containing histidine kinase [Candidatus Cloacimonadota bacterium]
MKKRYYLSMLSICLVIILFDFIYFLSHRTFGMFLKMGIPHILVFGFINYLGIHFLYKPIDRIFEQGRDTEKANKQINKLTWNSTVWIFIIGILSIIVLLVSVFIFEIAAGHVSTEIMPPIFFLSIIPSSLFIWAFLPSIITFFLINDFNLDLKKNIYANFNILYSPGKRRVGFTLLSVLFILGFFPTLLIILDLITVSSVSREVYVQFMHDSHEKTLLVDQFIGVIGFIFAIVFIPRSFSKPIYSLFDEIEKVRKGDYSTRAAIVTDDEIGHLTQNFNEMVHDLEIAHNKQLEYSHKLEKNLEQLNKEIIERERAEELARQQQQKLFQSEKMASVGTLVSGVAHEINNPNNFILLNSDNLADVWNDLIPLLDKYAEEKGDFTVAGLNYSEIRNEVSMIINGVKEGSERIKKIVQTLKDFARTDPGNLNQIINIADIIDDSLTILTGFIKRHTNHFSINLSEDIPKIKGNIQQIEQVIINLISNACQALENKEQKITVSTALDNKSMQIIVRDEGRGISSEDLKYIMDPFFTTKRDIGGTGLGLSISYNIIKDHGGELIINSEVGKGTTAVIKLPL